MTQNLFHGMGLSVHRNMCDNRHVTWPRVTRVTESEPDWRLGTDPVGNNSCSLSADFTIFCWTLALSSYQINIKTRIISIFHLMLTLFNPSTEKLFSKLDKDLFLFKNFSYSSPAPAVLREYIIK